MPNISESDARVAANAIGSIIRRADAGEVVNSFNCANHEDRQEYVQLIKTGRKLQENFEEEQRLTDLPTHMEFANTDEFREPDAEEYEECRHNMGRKSARREKPKSLHDERVKSFLRGAFFALFIGALVVAITFLMLNRNPFSKTCGVIQSPSSSPSPSKH